MCFPLSPLPSPGSVSPLLLGRCSGAKSWKRNLFKGFRTHVNGQNLLRAELKYLFLLHNKALLLNLSTAGFVPQWAEKSLVGRNRRAGKMPLVRGGVCLHSREFAGEHLSIPIARGGGCVGHRCGHRAATAPCTGTSSGYRGPSKSSPWPCVHLQLCEITVPQRIVVLAYEISSTQQVLLDFLLLKHYFLLHTRP